MNLLAYIPNENDATAYYRALQPLAQLRHKMDITLSFTEPLVTPKHISHIDVAFVQRPDNQDHLRLIQEFKRLKLKVWLDYDDNFFNVPKSNPASNIYNNSRTQGLVREMIGIADVVSVSTPELARQLEKETKYQNFKVIPNAFNDYLFPEAPAFKTHNLVAWRGTQSHQDDLLKFSTHILNASGYNKKWLFNFMGYNPWFMADKLENRFLHTDGVDILTYHEVIKQIYPNIQIVTLSDSPFNRCKSNIAWLEATYSGAVCLGPDFEEWHRPGVMNYHSVHDFEAKLVNLMDRDTRDLAQMHENSWKCIKEFYLLSKLNDLRVELLKELV